MNESLDGFLPPLDKPLDAEQRREFLKKLGLGGTVVAGTAVGGPIAGAATAHATPAGVAAHATPAGTGATLSPKLAAALPSIGAKISCTCDAFGTTLLVNLPYPLPKIDFIGGITIIVEAGGDHLLRLRVLDHTVSAWHELFGKITIELPDIDISPLSIVDFGPNGFIQTMFLSFKITFQKCGPCEGPFTLQTLKPATLVGAPLTFPPPVAIGTGENATGGAVYSLTEPIALGLPGGGRDSTVFAGFKKFNVRVGHVKVEPIG